MLGVGWTEMLVIGVVALIVIGPRELPALMHRIGKVMGTIRRMGQDFQREINKSTGLDQVRDLRKTITEPLKKTTDEIRKEFNAIGKDGTVTPTGALKPTDPKVESVVGSIKQQAGMATATTTAAAAAAAPAAAAATKPAPLPFTPAAAAAMANPAPTAPVKAADLPPVRSPAPVTAPAPGHTATPAAPATTAPAATAPAAAPQVGDTPRKRPARKAARKAAATGDAAAAAPAKPRAPRKPRKKPEATVPADDTGGSSSGEA